MDRSRTMVYALLTDLTDCYLFRVSPRGEAYADVEAVVSQPFPWYSSDATVVSGLTVLATLGSMSLEELGMMPNVGELAVFRVERWLGRGATASVYALKEANAVLKLAHRRNAVSREERADADDAPASLGLGGAQAIVNERAALAVLNDVTEQLQALTLESTTSTYLKHVPELLTKYGDVAGALHMRPKGHRLQAYNLRPSHVRELLQLLKWLHEVKRYLHGDISYRNLLLVQAGWRTQSLELADVLLLIDWGYAHSLEPAEQDADRLHINGTPSCMSRKALLAQLQLDLHGELGREGYSYNQADELESAVKSILLVAWPWFKAQLKAKWKLADSPRPNQDVKARRHSAGWQTMLDFWHQLPPEVYDMCERHEYDGLADWLIRTIFPLEGQ